MSLVLDCSVVATWCFEDERSEAGDAILAEVAHHGATVPVHWRLEVANMLVQAERRRRVDARFVWTKISELQELPVEIDRASSDEAWREALALSQAERLTVYDASYLELALRQSLPLATMDQDLAAAASRRGVLVRTA